MFQKKKAKYEESIAQLKRQEASAKKVQAEQEKVIEATKTDEERWLEDFNLIKRKDLLQLFQKLVSAVYKFGGVANATQISGMFPDPNGGVLAFAGTNDLIDFEMTSDGYNRIKLSDKGKYFSRLLADRGISAK